MDRFALAALLWTLRSSALLRFGASFRRLSFRRCLCVRIGHGFRPEAIALVVGKRLIRRPAASNHALKVRAESARLRGQLSQLCTDFLFGGQEFHSSTYDIKSLCAQSGKANSKAASSAPKPRIAHACTTRSAGAQWLGHVQLSCHMSRKMEARSVRIARRVGTHVAHAAVTVSTAADAMSVVRSRGCSP